MKKLNLICASIAALAATSAVQAGTATVAGVTMAVENFGPTSTGALAAQGGTITYTMGTITAVNGGSTVYWTVRLTGGLFAGTPAIGTVTFGGILCGTGGVACVITPSTDRTTIKVAITPTTTTTLGLGAFSFAPAVGDINGVNSTLNSVGGIVSASVGVTSANPASIELASGAQGSVDGALGTGTLITAARAITSIASAPTSTVQIDLTTSPAGRAYTAGASGLAPLARVRFSQVAGVKKNTTGDYVLAAPSAVTAVLTPGAFQVFPVGAVLSAYTDATCSAAYGTTAGVTVTAGTAASAQTVVTTAITPTVAAVGPPVVVGGIDYVICMTAPTPAPNVATPILNTVSATVSLPTATDGIAAATGPGYDLQYNGASVDVLTYWPGGLDAFSYKGYLRITNTGTVAANVSFAHVNKDTGALFNSAVIIANLLPGQSKLISSVAIDAVAGVAPSNLESGRARVTAPTNGLRVQSLLQTGNSAPIEYRANNGL